MDAPHHDLELQVGGTLNPRRHLYIAREEIETAVLHLLEQGEYCNILSPRQVGKSSLMMKVALRLKEQGVRVASIDIAGDLGTPANAEQWYQGFLQRVVQRLGIALDVNNWWTAQTDATINQRMLEFFRTQLFAGDDAAVVIFVDEIDHSLNLPYTDDFFTAIRTMYNQRAAEPAFEKITFCLVGVANPNELVKQQRTTAYNVGQTVELRDFDADRDDLGSLAGYLSADPPTGRQLLDAVLDWTGGQPYLTAWLCHEIKGRHFHTTHQVAELVGETFSNLEQLSANVHFQQIMRFLGTRVSDQLAGLRLYERILQGETVTDSSARTHIELKLSGLVRRDETGKLVPRNRIYEKVFDLEWVRQSKPRRTVRNLRRVVIAAVLLLALGLGWFFYDLNFVAPARQLVNSLRFAEVNQVFTLVEDLEPYRSKADPMLWQAFEDAKDSAEKLRLSFALLPASAPAEYLWSKLDSQQGPTDQRFNAALFLAQKTDYETSQWNDSAGFVAQQLIEQMIARPSDRCFFVKTLRPIRLALLEPLAKIFRSPAPVDASSEPNRRLLAAEVLAQYAADQPLLLVDLIADADQQQFELLFPVLQDHAERATTLLHEILARSASKEATVVERDRMAQQRANAAIALLRMGQEDSRVWSLLKLSPDPSIRSYLVDRLVRYGVDPRRLLRRFEEEQDDSVRQALLLGLGMADEVGFSNGNREPFVEQLKNLYQSDPNAGVHAAADWLLRQWQIEDLPTIDRCESPDHAAKWAENHNWYVNSLGMTLVKVPAGKFMMGSPQDDEIANQDEEPKHEVNL